MARLARAVVPGIPYHVTHRGCDADAEERLRLHTRTGRPCGDVSFVERIGQVLRRVHHPLKRGRKAQEGNVRDGR